MRSRSCGSFPSALRRLLSRPQIALVAAVALMLAMVAVQTVCVRHFFFSQGPDPKLRLSRELFPRLTDRLVVVLVDSVPFNMAFDPRKMPFVASLRRRATWGDVRTEEPSMTGQMVYTIATGERPFLPAVVRNWRQNRMPQETFLDSLAAAGLRIVQYGDVPWVEMFGDRFAESHALPEEGRAPSGRPIVWHNPENELDRRIVAWLDRDLVQARFDVLLWHMHGTDLVMHKYLRDSRLTADKLHWADLLVEGLVSQLDDGRTTFLVLSDHGCAANGRHGYHDPEARHAFYALFGRGVVPHQRRDILQVDISSTVSALFGRTPAAPSAGRPLVEGLAMVPALRSELLLEAARSRRRYLLSQRARLGVGALVDDGALAAAEGLFRAGRFGEADRALTRLLRSAHHRDLASRRERQVVWQVVFWLVLALGLGALVALLALVVPSSRVVSGVEKGREGRGSAGPGSVVRSAAKAGVLLTALWAVALLGSLYAGRLQNSHLDLWPALGKVALWGGVGVLLAVVCWQLRRWAAAAARERPLTWAVTVALAAGVLPGYFQGVYSLLGLMVLLALLLWPRSQRGGRSGGGRPGARPWGSVLFGLVVLGVAMVWEYHWRPWFYFTRGHVKGLLGAALAAGSFGVALAAVGRPWRRVGEGGSAAEGGPGQVGEGEETDGGRETGGGQAGGDLCSADGGGGRPLLLPGLLLALGLGLRHLLWPGPTRFDVPTAGDHLLAGLHVKVVALALVAGAWPGLRRLGLRGHQGATLGALALLGVWSSPFEATAFCLLVAALAPLGRARWLSGRGLAPAALAALLYLLARSVLAMPQEFYFNFTAVHDLLFFAPDMDTVLSSVAAPVAVRYTLPALVLLPLFWGRLDERQALWALLLTLLVAGARALHLLVVARLTIDQLYANWRGLGELIIVGFFSLGLAAAFSLWRLGGWAAARLGRSRLAPGSGARQGLSIGATREPRAHGR